MIAEICDAKICENSTALQDNSTINTAHRLWQLTQQEFRRIADEVEY